MCKDLKIYSSAGLIDFSPSCSCTGFNNQPSLLKANSVQLHFLQFTLAKNGKHKGYHDVFLNTTTAIHY